jgi:hypothetical protein
VATVAVIASPPQSTGSRGPHQERAQDDADESDDNQGEDRHSGDYRPRGGEVERRAIVVGIERKVPEYLAHHHDGGGGADDGRDRQQPADLAYDRPTQHARPYGDRTQRRQLIQPPVRSKQRPGDHDDEGEEHAARGRDDGDQHGPGGSRSRQGGGAIGRPFGGEEADAIGAQCSQDRRCGVSGEPHLLAHRAALAGITRAERLVEVDQQAIVPGAGQDGRGRDRLIRLVRAVQPGAGLGSRRGEGGKRRRTRGDHGGHRVGNVGHPDARRLTAGAVLQADLQTRPRHAGDAGDVDVRRDGVGRPPLGGRPEQRREVARRLAVGGDGAHREPTRELLLVGFCGAQRDQPTAAGAGQRCSVEAHGGRTQGHIQAAGSVVDGDGHRHRQRILAGKRFGAEPEVDIGQRDGDRPALSMIDGAVGGCSRVGSCAADTLVQVGSTAAMLAYRCVSTATMRDVPLMFRPGLFPAARRKTLRPALRTGSGRMPRRRCRRTFRRCAAAPSAYEYRPSRRARLRARCGGCGRHPR